MTRDDALDMTYPELEAAIKDMDAFLEAEAKVRKKAAAEGR